jgi:Protein of unknown function, DUF
LISTASVWWVQRVLELTAAGAPDPGCRRASRNEYSTSIVEVCRIRHPELAFTEGDARNLAPLGDASYGFVPSRSAETWLRGDSEAHARVPPVHRQYGAPERRVAFQATLIDGYAVEGHVSIGAVLRTLMERFAIKGISLPDMPAGSACMCLTWIPQAKTRREGSQSSRPRPRTVRSSR